MKYLRVILDVSLTFDEHIDHLVENASKKVSVIHRVDECLGRSTVLTRYKSLILPHFDYCDTIYMTSSLQNVNRLQLIHNAACRTILLTDKYTPMLICTRI